MLDSAVPETSDGVLDKMGWYRQLGNQMGLSDTPLSRAAGLLLLVGPCLLLPRLLASLSAPPAMLLPPLSWLAGRASASIGLPPTPAMLLVGLSFRATGLFDISSDWRRVVFIIRYVAVAVVLLKSGLGLCHLPNVPLAVLPCSMEATTIAALAHYLLGFPWHWGVVWGFVMSAASSSINAEKLTELKAGGYGAKELYGLLLPTSTVENIYSITVFTATLTMALKSEEDWWLLPVAICCGLLFALSWGFLAAMFPHRKDPYLVAKRSAMVLLGALMVYLGAKEFDLAPGGPLGTLVTGVAASFFWSAQGWTEGKNPVLGVVSGCWCLLEAALFGFVGAELDLYGIDLWELTLVGLVSLASILVRMVVFYSLMAIRSQFTKGETAVGMLVWLPKATVLAALSPQVLDNLRKVRGEEGTQSADGFEEEFRMGRVVLLGSVLEMLVTAPFAFLLLRSFGERLLPREDKEVTVGLALPPTKV